MPISDNPPGRLAHNTSSEASKPSFRFTLIMCFKAQTYIRGYVLAFCSVLEIIWLTRVFLEWHEDSLCDSDCRSDQCCRNFVVLSGWSLYYDLGMCRISESPWYLRLFTEVFSGYETQGAYWYYTSGSEHTTSRTLQTSIILDTDYCNYWATSLMQTLSQEARSAIINSLPSATTMQIQDSGLSLDTLITMAYIDHTL